MTTTVPVTAEDLLHLPARITFGTWASNWPLLPLEERQSERQTAKGQKGKWRGVRGQGEGEQKPHQHRQLSLYELLPNVLNILRVTGLVQKNNRNYH